METECVLTVVYAGEPDEMFEFATEGQSRLFGRDDQVCEIVIWSEINGVALSRIAGRLWRMDDELWVRNLSTIHELQVIGPEGPPDPPLPPRRDDVPDPGPARSIPRPSAVVRGPGGCELLVSQLPRDDFEIPLAQVTESTLQMPPIPDALRRVAAALCEPLLSGGQLPATYGEVTRRAGTGSLKRTRTLVGELCSHYLAELPVLRERLVERNRRLDAGLEPPAGRRLHGGVWTFADAHDEPDAEDAVRRRALSLPDYYEVAHLLVRRRLVTAQDVRRLSELG